ncbi:MAG: acyl-[ACP]--phospholipid O-acyltransferase [Planctomycetaceae bacterium]|nr:MAG: acyl-[ACP]--phospholipid O-acyltransferase [Planctomycetaceae bacterium]
MTFSPTLLLLIVAPLVLVGLILMAVFARRRFVRMFFRPLLASLYRPRVIGLENLPKTGGVVLLSNHQSWIDGILLLWMLPRNIKFIVDGNNFSHGPLKWLAGAFDTILMEPHPKSIARALIAGRNALHDGEVVGLFPEGALSRTGHLQAFKPGLGKIVKGSDAMIVPTYLHGMWGSIFSFSGGKFFRKVPRGFRRRLTLYIDPPQPADTPPDRLRSRMLALSARAAREQRDQYPSLPSQVIRVWRQDGGRLKAADSNGAELTGRTMLIRTLALRRMLRREVLTQDDSTVGILLPPSVAGVVVNVAMAIDRRVTANLNYTVTSSVLNECIAQAKIRTVLTSAKFLEKVSFDLDARVIPLEDLKDKVGTLDKLVAVVQAVCIPACLLDRLLGLHRICPDDLLTLIFTSGSTGKPKGVMLSHANISHNVEVVRQAVRLNRDDVVIGVLPFFHSFGYTVTLWSVMILGPCGVYHYNPLEARQIGKLAEKYGATVLLGTPTFLRGYLRKIEPEQFAKLSIVVVGAEKMPADLFEAFEKRFGIRPVEGYGTTELSPLVSVNCPPSRSVVAHQIDRLEGSVGRPLPGVAARIVSPDDLETQLPCGEDGMLLISGPNVMMGYLGQPDLTAQVIRDGWYVTGDIAHEDPLGFIHITGRLSRFSKIGGEMVPHIRIEEELAGCLSEGEQDDQLRVCVTAVPDPKRGERLVVLHLPTERTVDELRERLTKAGLPNLFIPSADSFFEVEAIPLLGTGKLDLKGSRDLADQLTSA